MAEDALLCRRVQQDMLLFLDGDLPEKDVSRIQNHLATCATCRAEMEAVARLWQVDATRFEPSPEVWMRVQAQIGTKRRIWARWRRELRGALVPAFRIAGIVAAIWLGTVIGNLPEVPWAGQEAARAVDQIFYLDAFDVSPQVSISQIYVE